jgi:hypothetical protein
MSPFFRALRVVIAVSSLVSIMTIAEWAGRVEECQLSQESLEALPFVLPVYPGCEAEEQVRKSVQVRCVTLQKQRNALH